MSKYIVSARKYRPGNFDQLVGQDHIARTLKNALQSDQLAHAFLFCGPRGVGKTTSARILAKVINCENPQNNGIDPCHECNSCKSFNENASFNIIELDAASNNSVDHIRTLIEQVRFQPQQGKYKVFIIDEVHMLSSQAFNAFLKTLEEPPPYAIFILATTEKHKILPTILSRCQIFDFKRIMANDIVGQLKSINAQEGRTADQEALFLIGQKADGAMRDALSIYDKIASAAGDHISYKDVVENLNILDYDYYFQITDALLQKDLSVTLLTLDEIIKKGFEPDLFIQGLSDHLRDLLICQDSRTLVLLEGGETLKTRYNNQAKVATKSFLMSALSILNDCDIALPRAKNKRLYVEIALGKINHVSDLITKDDFIEKKTEVLTNKPEASSLQKYDSIETKKNGDQFISYTSSESIQNSDTLKITTSNNPENILTNANLEKDIIAGDIKKNEKKVHEQNNHEQAKDEGYSLSDLPSSEASQQLVNTPNFSNINSLLDKIKANEAQKKVARKRLSYEAIEEIWKDYTSMHSSKIVQTALRLAKKRLEETTLHMIVPNGMTRETILQEAPLLKKIRDELGVDDLVLQVKIDITQFPGWQEIDTKKVLTNKEKYETMLAKNPSLEILRRKFDLSVDKS